MYPYWLTRTVSGIPILAGFLLFWIGLVTGPRNPAQPAPVNIKSNLEGSSWTREDSLQTERIFHGTYRPEMVRVSEVQNARRRRAILPIL